MATDGLQEEYNKAVAESSIFISLFGAKTGALTKEEFSVAWKKFQESSAPKIFTYFKNIQMGLLDIHDGDYESLRQFRAHLRELRHYPTQYETLDGLLRSVKEQLELLDSVLR